MSIIKNVILKVKFIFINTIKLDFKFVIVYFLSIVIMGLAPVTQLYIVQKLIEILQISVNSGITQSAISKALMYLFLEMCVFTFMIMIDDFQLMMTTLMGMKFSYSLQENIVEKLKSIDLYAFDDPDFYNSYQNAVSQTEQSSMELISIVTTLLTITVSFLGYLKIIADFNFIAIFLIMITLIPCVIFQFSFQEKKYDFMFSQSKSKRKMQYFYSILANKDNIMELKLFRLYNFFQNKRKEEFKEYYNKTRKLAKKEFIGSFVTNTFGRIGSIICLFWVFIEIAKGNYSLSSFASVFFAIISLHTQFQSMVSLSSTGYKSLLFLDFFFDFLNYTPKIISGDKLCKKNSEHTIEFVDVWFKYPKCTEYVLKGINFKISTRDLVLVFGENGSGKSTLVKLMLRFYDPTQGTILIDNIDIKKYNLDELYKLFTGIFQNYNRYSVSIKENIAFGNIEEINDLKKIKKAAKESLMHEFIKNLDNGYNSELTRLFEKDGVELSGGQWQKLTFCRVLFSNGSIVILDEPTSALDVFSEVEIYKLLNKLKHNKLIVLITHRLSYAKLATKIIILSDGKILDIGSHDELIKRNEMYAELYNMQIQGYNSDYNNIGINK